MPSAGRLAVLWTERRARRDYAKRDCQSARLSVVNDADGICLHEEKCTEKHRRRSAFEAGRSEEHTSELQSLMRISYAVFCLKKKKKTIKTHNDHTTNNKNETINRTRTQVTNKT